MRDLRKMILLDKVNVLIKFLYMNEEHYIIYENYDENYLKICGLCKFLLYKIDKFTLESGRQTNDDKVNYKIKYYIIYGKELNNELFLDKLCEYVPFIYESKNNQWYDIKIIREN